MPFASALTALAALTTLASADSFLGGRGYVDLSTYGGIPDSKGAGIIYGLPNAPAYSPDTSPARSTWSSLYQQAGISWLRVGGAQIPFEGYAAFIRDGNITGYQQRFASFKQNYQDARALNPNTKIVLLVHDIWGADSTQGSNTPFPCDNGDCTNYGIYLDRLSNDLKANNLLGGLYIDIWNEPDGFGFWPRSQDMTNYGCSGPSSPADYGNNVCLKGVFTGAEWLRPQNKREDTKQKCNQTAVTHLVIGRRYFNIFGSVPDEISLEMVAYFKNQSNYVEGVERVVSDLFLPYEYLAFDSTDTRA